MGDRGDGVMEAGWERDVNNEDEVDGDRHTEIAGSG